MIVNYQLYINYTAYGEIQIKRWIRMENIK